MNDTESAEAASGAASAVSKALAGGKIGPLKIAYFQMSAVGPLMAIAGVVPLAFIAVDTTAVPAGFLLTAAVMGLFLVGYLAYARHAPSPGPFYVMITKALGRPAGLSAALLSLTGYNLLQITLYGMIGTQFAAVASDDLHLRLSWWVWAGIVWAAVALAGLASVEISARVLGALSLCEVAVIIAIAVHGLMHPAGGQITFGALNPLNLNLKGLGPLGAIGFLILLGLEQGTVYAAEARDARRDVPRASFLALAVAALVYVGAPWAMVVAYGSHTIEVAMAQGPTMFFALAPGFLGSCARILMLTSLTAAALAYHNVVARNTYKVGRDGVLFRALARTIDGVPRNASLLQSAIGGLSILAVATFQIDPMTVFFYMGGTCGGFIITTLLALADLAVIVHFAKNPAGESAWSRWIAPGISLIALVGLIWACVANFALLIGVAPSDPVARILPALVALAVLAGLVWALLIKRLRPTTYQNMCSDVADVVFAGVAA